MVYDMDKINELIDDYADKSFEAGRLDERERIVSLIEKFDWNGGKPETMTQQFARATIIALIEGETE